jgi:riboflavin biosynthesis pyrimidine reductase
MDTGRRTLVDDGVEALSSTMIRVLPTSDGKLLSVEILRLLKNEFRAGLVLHEGGRTLFGQFLADGVVDELFLTLSPQVAGRIPAHFHPAR